MPFLYHGKNKSLYSFYVCERMEEMEKSEEAPCLGMLELYVRNMQVFLPYGLPLIGNLLTKTNKVGQK